jgi:hypothetical protein
LENHFVVGAGVGDFEFFGSDYPTMLLVEGSGGFAGVGPDHRYAFFASDGVDFVEQFATDAGALMPGGDGHPAELAGGVAVPMV